MGNICSSNTREPGDHRYGQEKNSLQTPREKLNDDGAADANESHPSYRAYEQMSSHSKGPQNEYCAAHANQQERARPEAPPNSASPAASAGSDGCVDGRRVVEFDITETADQLVDLLRSFNEREEKVLLKLTNTKKLMQFESFSRFEVAVPVDVFSCVGSVDLSSLLDVVKVPSNFLDGFEGLESVDLTPLSNVTEIGEHFLYASGLTQLDLSPVRNVRNVGKTFLGSLKSLKAIDLSPLSELTCIPGYVLYGSENLTSLNLQGLDQVERIGDRFCYGCSSLRHLDLSDMKSVTQVGDAFCRSCGHLESIDLSGFSNVRRIGVNLLNGCPRLKHVDVSAMQNLEEVGWGFLCQPVHSKDEIDGDDCANSSLKSINLSGLRKLKKIDGSFLSGCCNLTHVDLSAMQALEEVGEDFLLDCTSLQSINMKGLSKLTTVGDCFLCNVSSLEHLDLSGCVSITHTGGYFCGGCSSLQSVNFTSFEKMSEIENPEYFFVHCPKLSTVIGMSDCIRDKLPKDHPVRKHGQRYWRMFALLIREKSRGHAYDAFQIWNVMRFAAEFL